MSKSSPEQAIDALYQLPLDQFTAARNALAKDTSDAAIKKLEKPNLAAWAVNQLYWRERKTYDEIVKTSAQMRTAYKQMLAGKSADVRAAEVFHTEAIRKAKDAIRRILEEAGNKGGDAVMTPIAETLDALPTEDPAGRLTKPLRRTGFEALQGVTIAARPARPGKPKESPAPKKPAEKPSDKDKQRRVAEQQELAMAKERLRFAESAEREAEAALDRAKRAVERAERTRERIERELDEASSVEKAAQKDLSAAESSYAKAQSETERLRKKVGG